MYVLTITIEIAENLREVIFSTEIGSVSFKAWTEEKWFSRSISSRVFFFWICLICLWCVMCYC